MPQQKHAVSISSQLFWMNTLIAATYIALIICALMCALITYIAFISIVSVGQSRHIYLLPVMLLTLLGIGGIIGCYSSLRGLAAVFTKHKSYEPAFRITASSEKELTRFIMEICNKVGAQPPNTILLHAFPDAFVADTELQIMNGKTTGRVLAIGLPLLYVLSKCELRATLAHEFAHFAGKDVGSHRQVSPALQGIISTHDILQHTAIENESFFLKLPLYLPRMILGMFFINLMTTSAAIQRAQEYRADYIAAQNCGGKTFGTALSKIIGVTQLFYSDEIVRSTIERSSKCRIGYYQAFRETVSYLVGIKHNPQEDSYYSDASVFSSHPDYKTRVDSVWHLPEQYYDHEPALQLISNLDEYENKMNKLKQSYDRLNQSSFH